MAERGAAYLDASAFVKLSVAEPESAALAAELADWPVRVASELLRTEALRVGLRLGPLALARLQRDLAGVELLPVTAPVLELAGRLQPAALRSLDAVHLATALLLEADVGAIATYDARLAGASRALGLDVLAPA